MARKKHSAEQIVAILRQIEVEVANHKPTGQACRASLYPHGNLISQQIATPREFCRGCKKKGRQGRPLLAPPLRH
jgi:hypothetical protein